MNTTDILKKAEKLVSKDRAETHGDKILNHENIARLWGAYLQTKFKLNSLDIYSKLSGFQKVTCGATDLL